MPTLHVMTPTEDRHAPLFDQVPSTPASLLLCMYVFSPFDCASRAWPSLPSWNRQGSVPLCSSPPLHNGCLSCFLPPSSLCLTFSEKESKTAKERKGKIRETRVFEYQINCSLCFYFYKLIESSQFFRVPVIRLVNILTIICTAFEMFT